jgi:hypothetical protein
MLAAIIDPMSIGLPIQLRPPKTTKTGKTLGIMATNPAITPRDTNISKGVIVKNDHTVLLIKLWSKAD